MLDLLISASISKESYAVKDSEFELKKFELKQKIAKLEQPDARLDKAIDKVLNFGQNSFDIFKSSKTEEKRQILNIVFSNFLLDGENVEISMTKIYNLLSEIGGCQSWWAQMDSNQRPDRYERPALTN